MRHNGRSIRVPERTERGTECGTNCSGIGEMNICWVQNVLVYKVLSPPDAEGAQVLGWLLEASVQEPAERREEGPAYII